MVNPKVSGDFLCTSHCVRRSWLFGIGSVSGKLFDHREQWVEQQLIDMTDVFAMALTGFSSMGNHYHALVKTHPEWVSEWSDGEVADRWLRLSPKASHNVRSVRRTALLKSQATRPAAGTSRQAVLVHK